MNPQLEGIGDLRGTYPFDVLQSVHTLRLNRFFWRLREKDWRDRWLANRADTYDEAGLSAEERKLVDDQDWIGLIRYGVCFFVLEKFARVVGVSNLGMYASMRGETLEAFLKTRRVPSAA
jgi:hypothetical protein